MSDGRPSGLPEYGEYATPEEQAAASGVQPHWDPPVVAEPEPAGAAPQRWDVVLTIVLVAIGTFITINSIAGYADLPGTLAQIYAAYGYEGAVASAELASRVGIVLSIVNPALLVIAVVISAARLRAGRVTFWVPLLIGAIATVVSIVLFGVVLAGDPAFVDFLGTRTPVPTGTPAG